MYDSSKVAETIKNRSRLLGVQLKDMLLELDLNKNMLSNMYNGSMPKADNLAKIAQYLDCSVEYLLGIDQKKPTPKDGDGLDEQDRKLIELMKLLSADQKEFLLAQLITLTGQGK